MRKAEYIKNKNCKICKKRISDSSTYCRSCWQLGKNNPNYIDGRTDIKNTCIDCNKKLNIMSVFEKTKRCHSCENKRRHKLGIINSRLNNYKDGRTSLGMLIRNCEKNISLRLSVFKRDNFTCQICNKKGKIYLNSHHKIPVSRILDIFNIKTLKQAYECKLLWDINWCITLCEKCHGGLNEGKKH